MRIYRSPKDGVLQIDLRSFSLKGLIALVANVACVLAIVLSFQRIPQPHSAIVNAF